MGQKIYRQMDEGTNLWYGSSSIYEYFNYGVDLILNQFAPCEEALKRVKDGERIWEDRERIITDKYDQKEDAIQEQLQALEKERTESADVARLQGKLRQMTEDMRSTEERIARLSAQEPAVQDGKLVRGQEEGLRREYESLLESYEAGDTTKGQKAFLLQPLDAVLARKKKLAAQKAACDENIAIGKVELEVTAARNALQNIQECFTEQERLNPEEALDRARMRIDNPGDREQAAREFADAGQRIMVGNVSLDFLKRIGRGLFCIPMIPVRRFILKNVDWKLKLDPDLVMDGISLLLNIVLVAILAVNPGAIMGLFLKLLPVLLVIGLLAGVGIGYMSEGNLVVYAIGGTLAGGLLDVLLFVYPALLGFLMGKGWPFLLLLVVSVGLYAAADVYQWINHRKLKAEYESLLEKGRNQYDELLTYSERIVESYKKAFSQKREEESERISKLEKDLMKINEQIQENNLELAEMEERLWDDYRTRGIEEEEERWKRSRQELTDLRKRKQTIEENIRKTNGDLAECDRIFAQKRAELNQELERLCQSEEQEREGCRQTWEEENAQAKESYESLLASLTGQMRKDGFQCLTRKEISVGGDTMEIKGFDYRKAWSRIFYLVTSVIGMTPYADWYQRERSQGCDVLAEMVSDASQVPQDFARIVSTRLVTGIERCPMSAEIRKAVEEVMKDWLENDLSGENNMRGKDCEDFTMPPLPMEGLYKLCLNEVGNFYKEGDQRPVIFVYDFGNLDVNNEKRWELRNFILRTLCAPALQCWEMNDTLFHIDLMLTHHKVDFENDTAWRAYGNAGGICQGDEIKRGLEELYQTGQRTRDIVGNQSYYDKMKAMAWNDELTREYGRTVIFTNMDYGILSHVKDEVESVLDITKMDDDRNSSGIRPYFFMDLNRLQENKAAAQVCLDIVKNFKGYIYKLTKKERKPGDYWNEGFYDWKAVEKEKLQNILGRLAS